MAANTNDKITDTFNSSNPVATTVTAPRVGGGTSLSCSNLAGWPTVSKTHFATYQTNTNGDKVAGTQIDWSGIVSGTTIGSLVRLAGATDNGNAIGDVVEAMPTASWAHDLFTGLTAQHSQLDGSHKAITATSINNAGALTQTGTSTFVGALTVNSWDGYITATDTWTYVSASSFKITGVDRTAQFPTGTKIKLSQSGTKYFYVTSTSFSTDTTVNVFAGTDFTLANAVITSPAYSYTDTPQGFPTDGFLYTPTYVNLTVGNGTHASKFTMKGKTVFFRVIFTLGSTSSVGTAPTFTLPVASIAVPAATFPIATGAIDNTAGTFNALANWTTTTTALLRYWDSNNNGGGITSTVPGTWATGWKILLNGQYDSA